MEEFEQTAIVQRYTFVKWQDYSTVVWQRMNKPLLFAIDNNAFSRKYRDNGGKEKIH